MKKLCFLFNHDQTHQIAHSLPIALDMARSGGAEITLAVTDEAIERRIREIAKDDMGRLTLARLGLASRLSKRLNAALNDIVPARKLLLYRDNLAFFGSFDALVVSEKTSLMLKARYGLNRLKIIHTRHGAGDRAIGFGRESALFDLVLVAGPKIARRLQAEAGVDPARIRITGYVKFDLFAHNRKPSPFADADRSTVLYAPHPSPKLSSYYEMGAGVLDSFARSERFNLIFAPHVMLFERRWTVTVSPPALRRVPLPDPDQARLDHMLLDLGSSASTDMSYTNMADVYIGDVSSQLYEFLYTPRPCLHLNAHRISWRNDPNYAHWHAGPVIGPDNDPIAGVEHAIASFPAYRDTQERMFADTFSVTDEPASRRAATAIAEFLDAG